MSGYDQWLEAPYQRRASIEADIERVEEDLWNDDTEVSIALRLVSEALPAPLQSTLTDLVGEWATLVVTEGYEL